MSTAEAPVTGVTAATPDPADPLTGAPSDAPTAPKAVATEREYVVYEETDAGFVKVGTSKAKTNDDACWEVAEKDGTDVNARAKAAGAKDKIDGKAVKAPKLVAVSRGLRAEGYLLKPVAKVERVKG